MHKPKRIVIVGGGTAGWMAACLLVRAWGQHEAPTEITLIESHDIPTVGVGEGSTPYLRQFFQSLNIHEHDWMTACNATYKCGIRFPGWSRCAGFESYFHPFFSQLDITPATEFFNSCQLRRRGHNVEAHPDNFFVAAELTRDFKSPIPHESLGFEHDYAYHFDAGLLAKFLKDYAVQQGINHVVDHITSVKRNENGNIHYVESKHNGRFEGDIFFDCSGFSSLLMEKTLHTPYVSYNEHLFNDRAVAISTPHELRLLPSETVSTAASAGWIWRIPLVNRFGNGYVYSSNHLSDHEAEEELRTFLGPDNDQFEARHLKMRLGRLTHHWDFNCVAAGLSQGFIEPLEATAIGLIQFTIEHFIRSFEEGKGSTLHQESFNREVNQAFDGTMDYISLHYRLNSRIGTHYWIENREHGKTSDSLSRLIEAWDHGDDFDAALADESKSQVYMRPSWYCIFSGMGRYPNFSPQDTIQDTMQDAEANLARQRCKNIAKNFQPNAYTDAGFSTRE